MSTVSNAFQSSGRDSLTPKNGLSEAEKLKKRREARNKRILASGTDRLNRIVGLTSNSKPSTVCGAIDLGDNSKQKDTRSLVTSSETFSQPKKHQPEENITKNEASEKEPVPILDNLNLSTTPEMRQEEVPRRPMIDSENFPVGSNPLMEAFLKTLSEDKKETPRAVNGELSPIQAETPDLNEIMEAMLPQFLAQPATNAFLTFKDGGRSTSSRPASNRSRKSAWSPDGPLGSVLRLAFLAVLVLALLTFSASSKPVSEWEPHALGDGTIMELPLLGSLKPFHLLLSIEIGLQTQRYFFSQVTRRPGPQGMPVSIMQAYELFKFYSASWASLVDDFCLIVFLMGIWVLIEPLLMPFFYSPS